MVNTQSHGECPLARDGTRNQGGISEGDAADTR